ncbi:hypothetical protein [Roseiconus lacunae]|uniref:hypothetical protein n=1 Tax=Roseiconus lacunae TaxID=2605694 RepID=UPI001358D70D|nr:hypothetical protein [Roseiconus lacunae]
MLSWCLDCESPKASATCRYGMVSAVGRCVATSLRRCAPTGAVPTFPHGFSASEGMYLDLSGSRGDDFFGVNWFSQFRGIRLG